MQNKVLSVIQPYATFIYAGIKTIENQTWMRKSQMPLQIIGEMVHEKIIASANASTFG